MRAIFSVAFLALLAAPVIAQAHEADTHRFGATYAMPVAGSPGSCAAICDDDMQCKAWTYLRNVTTSSARCELKLSEGRPEHNPMAVSGLSRRVPTADEARNEPLRRIEPALAETPPLPKYYVSAMTELPIYIRPKPVIALPTRPAPKPQPKAMPVTRRVVPVGELPIIRYSTTPAPQRSLPQPLAPQTRPQPRTSSALDLLNAMPHRAAPTPMPTPAPAPDVRITPPPPNVSAPVASVTAPRYDTQPIIRVEPKSAPAPEANTSGFYPQRSTTPDTADEGDTLDYYQRRPDTPATPVAPTSISQSTVTISPPAPAITPAAKTEAGTRVIAANAQAETPAPSPLQGAMKP